MIVILTIPPENKNTAHNDADDDNKFKNDLAIWALSYNINHNACNALIKILRQYTSCNFPKNIYEHYYELHKLML